MSVSFFLIFPRSLVSQSWSWHWPFGSFSPSPSLFFPFPPSSFHPIFYLLSHPHFVSPCYVRRPLQEAIQRFRDEGSKCMYLGSIQTFDTCLSIPPVCWHGRPSCLAGLEQPPEPVEVVGSAGQPKGQTRNGDGLEKGLLSPSWCGAGIKKEGREIWM